MKSHHTEPSEGLKGKKRSRINLESSESDAEQSEGSVVRPFKGSRPNRGEESESPISGEDDQTDGDDNFIVEDDEQTTRLPVAFSMNTHQDLAHQFKIVCQLFVHMAVRSTAERRPFMKKMLEGQHIHCHSKESTNMECSGGIFLCPTSGDATEIIWDERSTGVLGLETRIQETA